ncbi:MFS transporter [Nocardiopsis sp. FR4]|uniref:MFS transporter n=1 Tax=Nocardiopsis sp. FR4 TaxID=2605985 RepID=UPI00191609C0|nr:MFS transporter [Nocardiopsis sp. FR4]
MTDVRDWRGRRYTVGPGARELTGAPRAVLLARALAAVAAVGVLQFGYGAAVPVLVEARGWSPAQALLPFLVWTLVQGSLAPAPHWLRTRGLLGPGEAICAGALLCAAALLALGHADGVTGAVLDYGVLGGLGAGLVYHSCADLVGGWFPDRHTVRLGAVGGAFALGAVPVLPVIAVGLSPEALPSACAALALAVLVLGVAGGAGQRSAPARWWPPDSDPRRSALRRRADPPAAGDLSAGQAWSSGSLPLLQAVVALSGACGLFALVVVPLELPAAVVALALGSGLGRLAASAAAEHAGRRRTLVALTAATALALPVLLLAEPVPLALAAALAVGAGTGSCYPLTRAIAEGHCGEGSPVVQHLVHASKAVGGLVGVGGAVVLLALGAQDAALAGFALLPAAACALAARLRRPLPVRTLPGAASPVRTPPGVWTARRRRAPM